MACGALIPVERLAAMGDRCAVCDTPEPPDAYALGWRSQTRDGAPDFHALLCPTCQQGDGDRLDNAR